MEDETKVKIAEFYFKDQTILSVSAYVLIENKTSFGC